MNIAVIGSGNVGGALADKWALSGHTIYLGVRHIESFKGKHLLQNPRTVAVSIPEAVEKSEVILIATPAAAAIDVAKSLGNTEGKIIIDAMNIVMGKGPEGYNNTSQALLDHTESNDVVKCFNTTGFNNMENPVYDVTPVDLFTCGDSVKGKEVAVQLAKEAGFAECYDIGGNDKFQLMEQFGFFWINLAMFQGQGREIAFKLLKR
jgi:predicted dinucleotide-binding enzyme